MKYPLLFVSFILAWQLLTPSGYGQSEIPLRRDTPPDTLLQWLPFPPLIDHEFPRDPAKDQRCYECDAEARPYESSKLKWFRELVYDPAMKNPQLTKGNKQFLDALLAFVTTDTIKNQNRQPADALIKPVFTYRNNVVICGDFVEEYRDFAVFYDTVLTKAERKVKYSLYYSNTAATKGCTIKDERRQLTECSVFRTNFLYTPSANDTAQPAFCSPFKLGLLYRTDTTMLRLLSERNSCESNCRHLCSACNPQTGFAQLKGVPALWFTTDQRMDEQGARPTRAIFININNVFALELWRYELDLSTCGCI